MIFLTLGKHFRLNFVTVKFRLLYFLLVKLAILSSVSAQCPVITGIMVNSCGGNTNEGLDEYFTIRNGANPLDISTWTVTFPSGTGLNFCNSGCGTNTWQLPNTTTANNIAAMTPTCPGLLVEPPGGIVPPFASMIVFAGATPTFGFDFCGSCNTGPVYAVFTNSFSTIGKFSNSAPRTLRVNFGGGCTDTAFYDPSNFVPSNTDGNYVSYDYMTGQPTYITQPCLGCITLPIRLTKFTATKSEQGNLLYAQFDSEGEKPQSVRFFKSYDGLNFQLIENPQWRINSGYEFEMNESNSTNKLVYYKVEYTLADESIGSSHVIKVAGEVGLGLTDYPEMTLYPNPGNGMVKIRLERFNEIETITMKIFARDGRLIRSSIVNSNRYSEILPFDFSDLPLGYYLITAEQGAIIAHRALIISEK